MHKYLGWILIALMLSASARGQSSGVGVGLNDLRPIRVGGAPVVPCATFVADYSVACNVLVMAATGIAR